MLFAGITGLLTLINLFNLIFDTSFALRISGATIPTDLDFGGCIMLLGVALTAVFYAFLIETEMKTGKKVMLWLAPIAVLAGIITVIEVNDANKYNEHFHLGEQKRLADDYEGAIASYTKAIKMDSTEAYYFSRRGYMQELLKNFDAAKEDYNKVIEMKSNGHSYYQRGELYMLIGDKENGCIDFHKAQDMGFKYMSTSDFDECE